MPNKEMTAFHTTLILRLITICNLIIIYICVLFSYMLYTFYLFIVTLLSKSLKMKSDEYVHTCKAYMDPKGLRLDLSTCKKVINPYNTYMWEKSTKYLPNRHLFM